MTEVVNFSVSSRMAHDVNSINNGSNLSLYSLQLEVYFFAFSLPVRVYAELPLRSASRKTCLIVF